TGAIASVRIPPTKLVDRSYSAYKGPSNAPPKSHQRSWWIVHTQPTKAAASSAVSVVPSTQFGGIPNGVRQTFCKAGYERSTNGVGGISDRGVPRPFCSLSMNDPPTALVGFGRENVQPPATSLK